MSIEFYDVRNFVYCEVETVEGEFVYSFVRVDCIADARSLCKLSEEQKFLICKSLFTEEVVNFETLKCEWLFNKLTNVKKITFGKSIDLGEKDVSSNVD